MATEVQRVECSESVVATIVLAFGSDPFVRWMLPEPERFLTYFSRITRLHGELTSSSGGAFALPDGRGAAFWYPPGVHPDGQAFGALLQEAGVAGRVASVWEQVGKYEPDEPHWYLRQIGVDPAARGNGLGSALLRAGLDEVDRAGARAYLEATSTASKSLYERHGFVSLGEVKVGDAPPLWPMVREPLV
jgi:ribosomal protein S18 acetylase RimI-like enzyme